MAKRIEIDRKKRLREEPSKGHNRWHPDIAPVIEVAHPLTGPMYVMVAAA